jgi:hypothetical protein
VFSGLSILGDTSFEFTLRRGDHKKSAIGLRSTSNHIFNEISVSWGINNGEVILLGFEFPKGNIDGNTSFSFSLEFI